MEYNILISFDVYVKYRESDTLKIRIQIKIEINFILSLIYTLTYSRSYRGRAVKVSDFHTGGPRFEPRPGNSALGQGALSSLPSLSDF